VERSDEAGHEIERLADESPADAFDIERRR
jgi:hypothetical protein